MARQVIYSKQASEDLESTWQYIARDSTTYASAVVTSILNNAEDLAEYPRSGQMIEQIKDREIREIPVYPYRLFYEVREQVVLVLAVAHGARDLNQNFFDRLQ